jgi:hypothetical protein
MIETKSKVTVEKSSEKSFGIVFSIVFLLISLYPLLHYDFIYLWALIVSVTLLFLAFVFPKTLFLPNKLWFKFGMLLGAIVAPIVMTLVYFTAVVPTGIFIRLSGKDLLGLKLDKNSKSYWIERKETLGSMKNQF